MINNLIKNQNRGAPSAYFIFKQLNLTYSSLNVSYKYANVRWNISDMYVAYQVFHVFAL